jgi:hypothetical protein
MIATRDLSIPLLSSVFSLQIIPCSVPLPPSITLLPVSNRISPAIELAHLRRV